MTRAIAGAVVLAAAVAACFSTPTRPGTGDSGVTGDGKFTDSLSVDSMLNVDGNPNNCATDQFVGSGSGTCGNLGWANPASNNGMVYMSSGTLNLNLFGGTGSFIACTGVDQNSWNRVTVDVLDVATSGPTNHTFLGLMSSNQASRWGVDFADQSGTAVFTTVCDGTGGTQAMGPWNMLKHRYIKVERSMELPPTMTISASENNMAFEALAECTPTADLTTTLPQLRAYAQTSGSGSGTVATSDLATFGFIELCHD